MRVGTSESITRDSRVAALCQAFFIQVSEPGKAPTTIFAYDYAAERHIVPGLGGLRVHELTVGAVHRLLRSVAEHHGPGTAKMCRSVLSGMCALAARHDALDRNPVRDVGPISNGARKHPRSLSAAEARQLRALLTYDAKAVERDLPDFVAMMLATGLRIGECAALRWKDLDLKAGAVTVRSTVVRLKGRGLTVKPTKSAAGMRTLALPSWCVPILSLRPRTDPVFPAPMGGWRDPSNTQADLRQAFAQAGFGWITSRTFRKTMATLMDEVGQSGSRPAWPHPPSLTQDVYFGRGVASTAAATVLEDLG